MMNNNQTSWNITEPERWGAMPEEWIHFGITLGLFDDLLPVVSNPEAKISEGSSIKTLGKTPSRYNKKGEVVGILNWPQLKTSLDKIERWFDNPNYGICIQTRSVRAIDVDITDPDTSNRVSALLEEYLGANFPKRIRKGSSKFLAIYILDDTDELKKQVLKTEHGPIEFLGNGQQFIAAGSHIEKEGVSRSRYEWEGELPMDIPTISRQRLHELLKALEKEVGVLTTPDSHKNHHSSEPFSFNNQKPQPHLNDPLYSALESQGLIRKVRKDCIRTVA